MPVEYFDNTTQGRFTFFNNNRELLGKGILGTTYTENTLVWNKNDPQEVQIDDVSYLFPANSLLPLMANQHFKFECPEQLVAWQFNRDFYCIMNHDKEVGCIGFLFYGISNPFFIHLQPDDSKEFELLEQEIFQELGVKDKFQGEMLRSLLRRLIIKTTRLGKGQCEAYQSFPDEKMEIIRKFALLVEGNYKTSHEVQFYAAIMNKAPKTLSNFFAQHNHPSPLKVIHNRIILEAKRYLVYTDKSAKEIAHELGFENPEHFSRFFRSNTGKSVREFRMRKKPLRYS